MNHFVVHFVVSDLILLSCVQYLYATSTYKVTKSIAEERCSELGGLASFEHFNPPPGTRYHGQGPKKEVPEHLKRQFNELNVQEGESIWVSGITEYGRFIRWQFCVNSLDGKTITIPINDTDLHECSKKCFITNKDSFFGIQQGLCYCLSQFRHLSNDSCNDIQFRSGIHIYRLTGISSLEREPFQCYVFASWGQNLVVKCSAHHPAVCESFDDKRTLNCTTHAIKKDRCLYNTSKNFVDHRDICWKSNGRLGSGLNEFDVLRNFYAGFFRTFKAVAKQSDSTPCLTITRVDGSWWLEPDNCTLERRYVCNNYEAKYKFNGSNSNENSANENNTNESYANDNNANENHANENNSKDNNAKENHANENNANDNNATENHAIENNSNNTKSDEIECTSKDVYNITIIFILASISCFAMITVIVLGVFLKRSCRMNTMVHYNIANETYEDLQRRNTT